jgi:thymidylate synthase
MKLGLTRTLDNCSELHKMIITDLMMNGENILPEHVHHESTVGQEDKLTTKELIGYSFTLNSILGYEGLLDSPLTTVNKDWAIAEAHDRITNAPNPGTAVNHDPKWTKMLEADGKFSYTYGERWAHQLPKLLNELKEHPNTRQAVLTTWDSNVDHDRLGQRRVPCTMHSQFLIRDGALHQLYYIRSNDAIWIMPSDVYQMCKIQEYLAKELNLTTGQLQYNIGSLHVYKRDAKLILERTGLDWV